MLVRLVGPAESEAKLSAHTCILVPMVWPAPGVTAEHLANVLAQVNGMRRPILAGVHAGDDVIVKYLQSVNERADVRPVLRKSDLDRLVYTPRYWATLANQIPTPAIVGAVRQETERREKDLDDALKEAAQLRDRWVREGTRIVVPDTGVFLNHKEGDDGRFDISTIAWRRLAQAGLHIGARGGAHHRHR